MLTSIVSLRSRDATFMAPLFAAAGAYGIYRGGEALLVRRNSGHAAGAAAAQPTAEWRPAAAVVMISIVLILLGLVLFTTSGRTGEREGRLNTVASLAGWLTVTSGAEVLALGIIRTFVHRSGRTPVAGTSQAVSIAVLGAVIAAVGVWLILRAETVARLAAG